MHVAIAHDTANGGPLKGGAGLNRRITYTGSTRSAAADVARPYFGWPRMAGFW